MSSTREAVDLIARGLARWVKPANKVFRLTEVATTPARQAADDPLFPALRPGRLRVGPQVILGPVSPLPAGGLRGDRRLRPAISRLGRRGYRRDRGHGHAVGRAHDARPSPLPPPPSDEAEHRGRGHLGRPGGSQHPPARPVRRGARQARNASCRSSPRRLALCAWTYRASLGRPFGRLGSRNASPAASHATGATGPRRAMLGRPASVRPGLRRRYAPPGCHATGGARSETAVPGPR